MIRVIPESGRRLELDQNVAVRGVGLMRITAIDCVVWYAPQAVPIVPAQGAALAVPPGQCRDIWCGEHLDIQCYAESGNTTIWGATIEWLREVKS
jgi:hypothetical protein